MGVTCRELSLNTVAHWWLAQRLFLCRLKSRLCGWDKMYSDSTATIWVISPFLIPLHLFRSDFIHLQIALRKRVLLKWGMNCALCVYSAFLQHVSSWWNGNSKHCPLGNLFESESSCCYSLVGKKTKCTFFSHCSIVHPPDTRAALPLSRLDYLFCCNLLLLEDGSRMVE